jgi:hypothetical protein
MGPAHQHWLEFPEDMTRVHVSEDHCGRIVPVITISKEIGAVRTYRDDLRAVDGESIPAPNVRKHLCSFW